MKYTTAMKYLSVFLVALFFAPAAAQALEMQMHTLSVSPQLSYINFKNDDFKEKGFLYGAGASYTYHGQLGFEKLPKGMLKIDGRIVVGRIDFDGVLLDGNQYKIDNVKDFLGEIRALGGYDFSIFESTTITPFTGLGYRFYKDQLQKSNAGYRRESSYLYSPIGVETNTPITKGWSAGVSAEFDIFWTGTLTTHYSDLDPLFSDVDNTQDKGYGLRGSIKIHKEMDDKNFIFEPYVNYWNISKSDSQGLKHTGVVGQIVTEPKNNSTEIGMKASVEF